MKLHLAEISRRGVFKTLAAYTVASWVLIEVVSVIASAFLLPNWTVATVATFFVLAAFPVLLFSWHYEISAEGITRDTSRAPDDVDKVIRRISIGVVIVLLGITVGLWANYFDAHSKNEVAAMLEAQQGAPEIGEGGLIRSIAVLPFDDFSDGTGRRLLADGIPETILHVLAQNKELLVTARTSSFFFRDKDVTASEIGRILNVQALLEGSIQVSGDRLRVTSQLVRTSDHGHIWSDVYEASVDDVFEVQDTIAATVRDLVMARTTSPANSTQQDTHPNLEAYEFMLEGRSLLDDDSVDSVERAISLLRLAVEIAPDYADAYAWLTMALQQKAEILIGQRADGWAEARGLFAEIDSISEKVLELDPDNAIAILNLGQSSQYTGGQGYDEAMKKALAVAPNDPDILMWVAVLDAQQLEFRGARTHLRRATQIDPGNFSILEHYIGQYCGRESLVPMVTTRLNNYSASAATAIRLRSRAHRCDGDYSDFMTGLTRLIRIDSEPASALMALQTMANLGDDDALRLIDEAHKSVPGAFSEVPPLLGNGDLSVYFPSITADRIKTFRWNANNDANPYFFMTLFALLQIQVNNLTGAAHSLAYARHLWDDYYEFRNETVMSTDTLAIYALQNWVIQQLGGNDLTLVPASELAQALDQRGLDEWSESRDQLQHFPLLILLLNGDQEKALQWFRNAATDRWIGFQAVLTSPMYEEFRSNPEVAEILEDLVAWRAGVLAELRASDLPELRDPGQLIRKIEETVPPSEHHRARIAFGVDRDFQAAAKHFEQALAQETLDSGLLGDALRFTYTLGWFDKATELAEFAVRQLPNEYFTHYELGFTHFWSKRWAMAIESFEHAQKLNPESTYLFRWLGIAKIMQGDAVGGLEEIEKLPDGWSRLVGLAIANHALGRVDEADTALDEFIKVYGNRFAYIVAYVLAYHDDKDLSFEWLQKAIDWNSRGLWSMPYQPLFANIHDDPRWQKMLQRLDVSAEQGADVVFDPIPERQ